MYNPQRKGVICVFPVRPSLLCHLLRFSQRSRELLSPRGRMGKLKQIDDRERQDIQIGEYLIYC